LVATVGLPGPCWSDEALNTPAAAAEAAQLYRAVPLDQEGRLADALPLYRAQAEASLTKADRLRYAGALMRAGRADEAGVVYDQVSREVGSVEHGGRGAARGAAICASSLLANGFPGLAVPYAKRAHRLETDDPTLTLLLVRALAASGDTPAARTIVRDLPRDPDDWVIGQRIELARWQLLTGDANAARRLLNGTLSESVAQMYRDSILANLPFRAGNWQAAAELLQASQHKVPSGLHATRVDRAWRNTQRELWWVQLRRAVALWKSGDPAPAAREAANAQHSDEEYVRSAATLLLVASDLTAGQRDAACARLRALAGHDRRFEHSAAELAAATSSAGAGLDAAQLAAALAQLDRSADFVARPLCQIVADAVHAHAPAALSSEAASPMTALREW